MVTAQRIFYRLNVEVIHKVPVIAVDLVLKIFVSEIIDHIIFVALKSSDYSRNFFFVDMQCDRQHSCSRVCMRIKMKDRAVVAFDDAADLRNGKLRTFHYQHSIRYQYCSGAQ